MLFFFIFFFHVFIFFHPLYNILLSHQAAQLSPYWEFRRVSHLGTGCKENLP